MAFDRLKKALGFQKAPESEPAAKPPKVVVVRPDADRCPACGLSPAIWRATSGNCGCSDCARKV